MTATGKGRGFLAGLITRESLCKPNGAAGAVVSADYFFGVSTVALAVTFTGSSLFTLALDLTAWAYGSTGWTLTTSGDRYVVIYPNPPSPFEAKVSLTDRDHKVGILVRTSEDGRDAYEATIRDDAGTWNLCLRKVVDSKPDAVSVTNGAGDTPPSAACEVDVTTDVPDNTVHTLAVRYVGGVFEVRIDDETNARLRHTPTELHDQTAVGFVSEVNGARVTSFQVCDLVGQRSGRTDVLVGVSDGDVWASLDGENLTRVASGVMGTDGKISMAEFNGKMLMVGTGKALKFDPILLTTTPWSDRQHPTVKLPGATDPGTTTASIVVAHRSRAWLGDIDGDEQNAYASAINDDEDFDTGSELPGRAFTISGFRASKIGQPIRAMQSTSNGTLLVGCTGSVYEILGDPLLGAIEVVGRILDVGISGKDSMWLADTSRVLAHGGTGLMVIPAAGDPASLSGPTLTEGIQIADSEVGNYTVVVIRDPARFGSHVFLTPLTGDGVHFWYDERVGGFMPGRGGFHPWTFPTAMQPGAACIWRGVPVFGCNDGYVRRLEDTADTDDGTPIDSRAVLNLIRAAEMKREALLDWLWASIGEDSGPVRLRVYGASSPERVYVDSKRRLLAARDVTITNPNGMKVEVRGNALVVEVRPTAARAWEIEQIEAQIRYGEQNTVR